MSIAPTNFPTDAEGLPVCWPDPKQPTWYVDAWNGIYPSREFALSEFEGFSWEVAGPRLLAYGERALAGEG